MLSAALSAWANLLIGWENPHRGSYRLLQPPITAAGVPPQSRGVTVSCLTLDSHSILWPRGRAPFTWFSFGCCLFFLVLAVILLNLDFKSVTPWLSHKQTYYVNIVCKTKQRDECTAMTEQHTSAKVKQSLMRLYFYLYFYFSPLS